MNTAASDRSSANPGRPRSRPKRLVFSALLLLFLYLVTEVLVFVILGIFNQEFLWMASTGRERSALQKELENRQSSVLQVHPFVGFTEAPPTASGGDSNGVRHDYAVNPFGYADRASPIHTRSKDQRIIGIMGGSVAWGFHMHATERLKALLLKDPVFAGKNLVFVNLAVSGYKQPQQLMTLNYMLVLGAEFDLIVNIDGFNEAALYEAENEAHHDFPAFPRSWHTRVQTSGPRVARFVGRLEHQAEVRENLARDFSRPPWRYSPLCNFLWSIFDMRAEIRIHELEIEYTHSVITTPNYIVEGPAETFASPEDLHRHLVSLWKNSSMLLNKICATNRIRYYHFLQPNLFLSGIKPLTDSERRMSDHRDQMYRPGVMGCYPLMIQEGRDLKAGGERFTDLTRMYDSHSEAIYTDICHVYQAGYDVMADRVAESILADHRKDAGEP